MRRAIGTGRKTLARFGRARDGVAALEFALVAAPFLMMLVGLGEIAMIGFAQANLNNAVSETARQIRTGQAQTNGVDHGQIQAQLCEEVVKLMSFECGRLYLDVKRFDSFVDAANPNPIQDGQFDDSGFGYEPGDPSDIVVVRAFYRWNVITPLFEPIFANVEGGGRVLASTMMFRNEPFPDPTPDE